MENKISSSAVKLLPQITEAIPGVTTYAVTVGLPVGMAATMTAQKTALQTEQNQYLEKVTELKASQAAKRVAMKAGITLITLVRETAKPTLGPKFSQNWAAFGFTDSLKVPRTVSKMVSMLGTLAGHLTTHPEFGSEALNTDAPQAELVRDNLVAAVAAVNVKKSEVRQKFDDRAVKAAAVRMSLREVLSALKLKFGPLDGRWAEFGFNRPGVMSVPAVPQGMTGELTGSNGLNVKWPAVARAEYYRLWLKVIGQDADLVWVGNTTDLDFFFGSLPANSQVEVAVSAANNGGESAKSAVLVVLIA